mmetsp:Transcript_1631/g.3515  ORF Transcript_1631/g.3515 Transcript_1631/m.3515 type:complete len:93 (-) Transcript_1631:457-735(-)
MKWTSVPKICINLCLRYCYASSDLTGCVAGGDCTCIEQLESRESILTWPPLISSSPSLVNESVLAVVSLLKVTSPFTFFKKLDACLNLCVVW